MPTVSAIPNPQVAASEASLIPYTRAFESLLRVIYALVPSIAIAYLYFLGNPALRFIDYGIHEIAIGLAVSLSAFVSYVTWRCYRLSGEPFLRWLAQGMTGFTLVYLPHGVLTRTADCNLWRFLLYGPVSRIVMVACLAVALWHYGAPADSPERRRSLAPLWRGLLAFALLDAVVVLATQQPVTYGAWLRIGAEGGSLALSLLCIAAMMWRGLGSSPLMQLYLLAMAFFAQSSFSFFLARPWDHQWWLAHGIFAGGFLILSYGVIRAFHTTRTFATVYSQEEMMRRLEFANAELERLAATDSLTGAANRRHFLQRVDEELARAERSGEPLSLLMMDLDLFKAVNDRHGHQAGDATLVAFVNRTREILRLPDVLGRLGGEEFSALLVGSSSVQAASVAERIRGAMEQNPIQIAGGSLRVTVSIGVAEFGPDGTSVDSVLRAADERLYRAKGDGRNRVGCR
jgi:diguanylate cyclase (GGDEF)-like protein